MENQLAYRTALTRTIIAALREAGYEINTRHAIDIGKILSYADLSAYPTIASLKYLIAPVISRNKEEQEIIHKHFNKLDQQLKPEDIAPPPPPSFSPSEKRHGGGQRNTGHLVVTTRKIWNKASDLLWWEKTILIGILTGILLLIAYSIIHPTTDSGNKTELRIGTTRPFAIDSPAVFTAQYDTTGLPYATVNWRFDDDSFMLNKWSVARTWSSTGNHRVTAYLHGEHGAMLDSAYMNFDILCEKPPIVTIQRTTDSLRIGKANSRTILYSAAFTHAKDKQKYQYKWYHNDQLAGTDSVYSYIRLSGLSYGVTLVVDTKNAHCNTDSITATYEEVANTAIAITGNGTLQLVKNTIWKNITLSLLWLFVVPAIAAYLLYRLLRKFITKITQPGTTGGGKAGPYTIEFTEQLQAIRPEPELKMLADTLRKRQASDVLKLHVKKTIMATIRAGGIPELVYSPLTAPTDYLVFIDKENPNGHLTRLYEYLIAKLQKEQVHITVYEYYKEPIYLSNQALNHRKIPVERIAALYPNTTLFIFGDTRHFVDPFEATLKPWVNEKLGNWNTRIFITPYPVIDWNQQERLLSDAGFFMIPADIEAQFAIAPILNKAVEAGKQDKLSLPDGYNARHVSFSDFGALKHYLDNEYLLQWVCSLAVYSTLNWNLTLSMGKALEKHLQNKQVELVNYTNLLKLGRISWMQDGQLNNSLRVQMLEYLDKEIEALARKTLLQELESLKGVITDQSFVKATYEVYVKTNTLLLDAYNNKLPSATDNSTIGSWIENGYLDEAELAYLNKAKNTLLTPPSHKKGKESVTLRKYLTIAANHKSFFTKAVAGILFVAGILLSWIIVKEDTNLLTWSQLQPVDQTFRVRTAEFNVGDLEATFTIDNVKHTAIYTGDSTFYATGILIEDTSTYVPLTLVNRRGETIATGTFKPNARQYDITVSTALSVPTYILYNGPNDLVISRLISQRLPANFNDSLTKMINSKADTGILVFYSPDFATEGQLAAEAIRAATGLIVQAQPSKGLYEDIVKPGVFISVNIPSPCTPVSVSNTLAPLNEIWRGGTSNRLVYINTRNQRLYYSIGSNMAAIDTLRIEEMCLLSSGVFRVICTVKQGYKAVFIRNITATSFEFSMCQNTYATKQEILSINMEESYCDRFNIMRLYYENNPERIYLPVNNGALTQAQLTKLRSFSLKKEGFVNVYENIRFLPPMSAAFITTINQNLKEAGIVYVTGQGDYVPQQQPTPFDRHYMIVKGDLQPQQNTDTPRQQPTKPSPRCDITFRSIDEALKQAGPEVVCKLDLSASQLSELPVAIFRFVNLQELNLGHTNIPEESLNELRRRIPKISIIYTRDQEETLGYLRFTKSRLDGNSEKLLLDIANQLKRDQSSKIRFEGAYRNEAGRKEVQTNINTAKNLLYKYGVNQQYGQIQEKLMPFQQQQQTSPNTTEDIHVVGINYRVAAKKN